MTVGSLFSGIGGIDLGLQRAGMTIAWQVENDPYCLRVLTKHWPEVRKHGDIRILDPRILPSVDLVAGGFPCQPVSQAGHKRGPTDPRWLWPDFARVLRVVRPRYVLVENVPGLRYRWMGTVLDDLAEIGYDAEWESLPAAAVGAPHLRDRVWIVAYPCGVHLSLPAQPEQQDQTVFPARHGEHEALADAHRDDVEKSANLHTTLRAQSGGGWTTEPGVLRVAHGVRHRVERLRGLGNAVVPQLVEWIGQQILRYEAEVGHLRQKG